MITTQKFNQNTWINIKLDAADTDKSELKKVYTDYEIDEEVIAYSLDENERPHLDYDKATGVFVLIYNAPNPNKVDNHYETVPMTFIVKDSHLITVTHPHSEHLYEKMLKKLVITPDSSIFEFLFDSLFWITDQFFPDIESMNDARQNVNLKLRQKTSKENLLALSDLEIGVVFYVAAAKQNAVLLEQIRTHAIYKEFSDDEKESLDDATIEAKQLVEMTQLTSQILQQLSSSYNNVLNNDLNDRMKLLTMLSILLTIPTIVTGFFGMNMPLPLEHNALGTIIVISISLILWALLYYRLRRLLK
ncbi:magnesium transporter CorA family protein [Pseudolactococcus insecticola]|uniref:Magnesium transporter n=1 Tax=Pseudolactococcus insecticola TaxID=2709158 RepID=A0A6A0BBW5_9LACT|nr:magnesium transporter CorA family protein [Lactococcus insecticola]GFH41317.1 magnesium transporter [Lactococcus insecticola]